MGMFDWLKPVGKWLGKASDTAEDGLEDAGKGFMEATADAANAMSDGLNKGTDNDFDKMDEASRT